MSTDDTFFKVWRNSYLKFKIFKELELYKAVKGIQEVIKIENIRNSPYRNYITSIEYLGYELFEKDDLPSFSLTSIKFLSSFKITNSNIPDSVTSIEYPGSFCYCCYPHFVIPSVLDLYSKKSITTVINPYIDGINTKLSSKLFPEWIKHIRFNQFFNGSICNGGGGSMFPVGLETLIFGSLWKNNDETIAISDLPRSLTKLDLGCYTNEVIVGLIPDTVIDLTMNQHPIYGIPIGVIPKSVKYLSITNDRKGYSFENNRNNKYTIGGMKEKGIFDITLNDVVNSVGKFGKDKFGLFKGIDSNSIPSNVTSLEFGQDYSSKISKGMIPSTVKQIWISSSQTLFSLDNDSLPQGITHFIAQYWNPVYIKVGFFPSSLTYLNLGNSFSQPLVPGLLPEGLKLLRIGSNHQSLLESGSIPLNTKVEINYNFNYRKLT